MGFGCPREFGFECWKGDEIANRAIPIDSGECSGNLKMDIGNGVSNGPCVGTGSEARSKGGKYTETKNGITFPLGGWHREPVFEVASVEKLLQASTLVPSPVPPTALFTCYNSRHGRPLQQARTATSVSDCLNYAQGSTYMGFGCPRDFGFECWKGDVIAIRAIPIDNGECSGSLKMDIGNGVSNGPCVGRHGKYTEMKNGVTFPLGGWHREPVFEVANVAKLLHENKN